MSLVEINSPNVLQKLQTWMMSKHQEYRRIDSNPPIESDQIYHNILEELVSKTKFLLQLNSASRQPTQSLPLLSSLSQRRMVVLLKRTTSFKELPISTRPNLIPNDEGSNKNMNPLIRKHTLTLLRR